MSPMDGARRQLLASFLAMEAPSFVVKLARDVGNGFIADGVQAFFYNSCLNNSVARKFPPNKRYLSSVLKQIILAAESDGQVVLDDLYEQQITLLNTSKKSVLHEMGSFEEDAERCYKSYLYSVPDDAIANMADCLGKVHASKFRDMILTIRVSSNMLKGSTGCYAWPAGLFLSEFLLAYPAIFSGRCCLEIGAGAGLSSICLALLHASKVIATDGNPLTMANLRHNFLINGILLDDRHQTTMVECQELLWESATEDEVVNFGADVIIGADIIYDPSFIPHLVQLLTWFLSRHKHEKCQPGRKATIGHQEGMHSGHLNEMESSTDARPIAFLATVIRNIDTINMFISSARLGGLLVEDVTQSMSPSIFLPQITGIDRSAICLHKLSISSR